MQFFIENIFLISIAFFSGAMLIWPAVRSRASGPALTTLQVTQLINSKNATIVDIRPPEEFAKGSLPNARNLPADKVKDRSGELKKDKPLIVICANGSAAGKVAAQLRSSGFNDVFVLNGGLAAWREAGLPIRT
ncbi:MAG TPA: rhodanese-like domain-containing protein [Burkholderiaceae bacterium]|nr:rhodanese-like domain-containing protein [Burkholderiaceae bacterium]